MPTLDHGGMQLPTHFLSASRSALLALACALLPLAQAQTQEQAQTADTSAVLQMQRWSDAAGAPASAKRGRVFFTKLHGGQWSCASCHGDPPTAEGRDAETGSAIAPLASGVASAVNPERLTNTANLDQSLRRDCKQVLGRECTPIEKSDLLVWLLQLQAKGRP